jgi:hypothetical protein
VCVEDIGLKFLKVESILINFSSMLWRFTWRGNIEIGLGLEVFYDV